jgi:hypothetical protein
MLHAGQPSYYDITEIMTAASVEDELSDYGYESKRMAMSLHWVKQFPLIFTLHHSTKK